MKIAHIPIVAIVDGKRQIIPPGGEIPADMNTHDLKALEVVGAVLDSEKAAKANQAQSLKDQMAKAQFLAARNDVQLAVDSTKKPPVHQETSKSEGVKAAPVAKLKK